MSAEIIEEDDYEDNQSDISISDLKEILEQNSFDENIKDIRNEISELGDVYNRIKKHTTKHLDILDGIEPEIGASRRMNTAAPAAKKVSPVYLSSQVGNMVSIKTLQTNLMKQVSELQQSKLDRSFKIIKDIIKTQQELKGEGASGGVPKEKLLELLMNMNITIPISTSSRDFIQSPVAARADVDSDSELEQAISAQRIDLIDVNLRPQLIGMDEVIASSDNERESDAIISSDNSSDESIAASIYVDVEDEKYYIVNSETLTVIETIDSDSVSINQLEDQSYFCENYKLPVIFSEEPEFE